MPQKAQNTIKVGDCIAFWMYASELHKHNYLDTVTRVSNIPITEANGIVYTVKSMPGKYVLPHQILEVKDSEPVEIPAGEIASGDHVYFPRLGWRVAKRISSLFGSLITFSFDDYKVRSLEINKIFKVYRATAAPQVSAGELFRKDLKTNRISILSNTGFLNSFRDVTANFKAIPNRVMPTHQQAALEQLIRGARLYTESAVYWIPQSEIDRVNNALAEYDRENQARMEVLCQ